MKSRIADDVGGEQVEVVEPPHRDAAAVIALGDVLQRRPFVLRRLVFARVVVELEDMAVGAAEAIGAAVAEIAVGPADAAAHRLDRRDAPLERRLATRSR